MPSRNFEHVIVINDQQKKGLYTGPITALQPLANPLFFRGDENYGGWRLVEDLGGRKFREVTSSYGIKARVGTPDTRPVAGLFNLLITHTDTSSQATGDTDIGASDAVQIATLEAAIAASLAILSINDDVTVELDGADFILRWDNAGVREVDSIAFNSGSLQPESEVLCERLVVGGANSAETWRISVVQKGYAFAEPTTAYPTMAGPITAVSVQSGSTSLPSIQRLTLTSIPEKGPGLWSYAETEISRIACVADVSNSLDGKYFDVCDEDGPVRVVMDTAAFVLPDAPSGGRILIAVAATNDTADDIAAAVATVLDADSKFVASSIGNIVTVTCANAGPRDEVNARTSTFSVSRTREGCSLSASIEALPSAQEIETAYGDLFTVQTDGQGVYTLTGSTNGARTLVSVVTSAMVVPAGKLGNLDFSTYACALALATETEITATYEVEVTETSDYPRTVLQIPCVVRRDLIRTP